MQRTAYLAADVARLERSHRGSLYTALTLLVLLAVAPVFAHHLPLAVTLLEGRDHIWALCLVALHVLLAPFHGLLHILLAAGLGFACFDRARAGRAARRALAGLPARSPEPGSILHTAAQLAALEPRRIFVVPGLPTPAFTAGWLRPRVYVAAELPLHLAPDEVAAVLAHEAAHVRRCDPLRLSALQFLRCTLFWLPAVRQIADAVADEAEIRADDDAAARAPLPLARALVRLGHWRHGTVPGSAVGVDHPDLFERRVRRLAGQSIAPARSVPHRAAIAAVALLTLSALSAAAVSHPMPGDAPHAPRHCHEHGPAALLHLFCLGLPASRSDCPDPHAH